MHNPGQLFIGKVLDMRDSSSDEQQQVGESLTFQARVQGWEKQQKEERVLSLLAMNDTGLVNSLQHTTQPDILLLPREYWPEAEISAEEAGWWYRVRQAVSYTHLTLPTILRV